MDIANTGYCLPVILS